MKTTPRTSKPLQEDRRHAKLGRGGFSNRGKHINKFEKNNNISINVFRVNDDGNVVLHRKAKIPITENHLDLLLVHEDEKSPVSYTHLTLPTKA